MALRNKLSKKLSLVNNHCCIKKSKKVRKPSILFMERINNLDENDRKRLHFLTLYLSILFALKNKKDVILNLQKFRNKDVVVPFYIDDKSLNLFYQQFTDIIPIISNFVNNEELNGKHIQSGGFYFKRLEEKGNEPITGEDISRLLDEIQGITGNLRYVPEGRDLTTFDVLLSLFRGDEESFKSYVKFFIAPRFYQFFPPKLKYIFTRPEPGSPDYDQHMRFAGGAPLWERYEDMGDYLLAYQSHEKAKNQYYVDQGLMSPDILKPGFLDKLTAQIDKVATNYSMMKMQLNPKRRIIM